MIKTKTRMGTLSQTTLKTRQTGPGDEMNRWFLAYRGVKLTFNITHMTFAV